MQVIGLCRFSHLGYGSFQVGHETLEEHRAFLYAPERMEQKFRLFETLTLPSIRAQTDPDFTLLIVTGTDLPDPYLERLLDLTEDIPQAVIAPYGPGRHREVMAKAVNKIRHKDTQHCLQFRMDDDDAVSVKFVQRFRQVAHDVKPFANRHPHLAIDFNKGFVVRPEADGIGVYPQKRQFTTSALGLMIGPDNKRSVLSYNHAKIWADMPTFSFTSEDMWIRGHCDFNDSRMKNKVSPIPFEPITSEQSEHFHKTFNVDSDHITRAFNSSHFTAAAK